MRTKLLPLMATALLVPALAACGPTTDAHDAVAAAKSRASTAVAPSSAPDATPAAGSAVPTPAATGEAAPPVTPSSAAALPHGGDGTVDESVDLVPAAGLPSQPPVVPPAAGAPDSAALQPVAQSSGARPSRPATRGRSTPRPTSGAAPAITGAGGTATPGAAAAVAPLPPRALFYGDGINGTQPQQLANAKALFGKLWRYGSEPTYRYLASRGVKVVRLGILWEHLQPQLGAPLDPTLLSHLTDAVAAMRRAGISAVLDLHNYCGYRTAASGYQLQRVGQGVVTEAQLVDLWTRLSTVFKNDTAVDGYGLMNEPADCFSSSLTATERFKRWEGLTERLLMAIRNNGDTKRIFVSKMEVTGATKVWSKEYPAPWIRDPASNFVYEQHHYSDENHSGTYTRSYATELQRANAKGYSSIHARDVAYLAPFLDWCKRFDAPCFIGEYGVPTSGPDATQWAGVARALLRTFDAAHVPVTWLGVGELWGHHFMAPYEPSVHPGPIDTAIPAGAAAFEAAKP